MSGTSGEQDEELRLSALSGLRWTVVIGLALIHVFAGSHSHLELVYGPQYRFPDLIAAPVTACLWIGDTLAPRGLWPVGLVLAAYVLLERFRLRHASANALRACGRVIGLVLAGMVLAFNVPLIRLLWGGV